MNEDGGPDVAKAETDLMKLFILAKKTEEIDFDNLHAVFNYINTVGVITMPAHFLNQEMNLDLLQKLTERGQLFSNVSKKAREDNFWKNRLV